MAAEVLLRIGLLTDNSDYQRRAATIFRLTGASLQDGTRPVSVGCCAPWISTSGLQLDWRFSGTTIKRKRRPF